MVVLVLLMALVGLVASGAYLVLAHPRRLFSMASVNANAWVLIVFLQYARTLLVLVLTGAATYTGRPGADAVAGVLTGYLVDALVVYRLVSFLRYRVAYRKREDIYRAGLAGAEGQHLAADAVE